MNPDYQKPNTTTLPEKQNVEINEVRESNQTKCSYSDQIINCELENPKQCRNNDQRAPSNIAGNRLPFPAYNLAFSSCGSHGAAKPITAHPTRAPALPVFKLSSLPPLPEWKEEGLEDS